MVLDRIERVSANGLVHAVHRFSLEGVALRTPRRTVLLVHGFLDAASSWELFAEPLCRAGFDVVAPDLRGFGATDRVGAGGYYHFPDYVADLDDLLAALSIDALDVVGHSMGGGVATLFAGAFPSKVKHLVNMEGLGPMTDAPALAVDRCRKWLADRRRIERSPRTMTRDEGLTRLKATHPRIGEEVLRSRLDKLVVAVEGKPGHVAWAWDPIHRSVSPTPFHAEVFGSFSRAVECPVLFVDGGPQGWHPPDEAERLSCFRDLRTVSFPEAGHMMHWTAPNEVAAAVIGFLDQS